MIRNDLHNPKYWYEQIRSKDELLTRLKIQLQETEGKAKGYEEISVKRSNLSDLAEQKYEGLKQELHYLRERNASLESNNALKDK